MHQLLFRGHQPEDVEGRQGNRHCQRPCCCRTEQEPCHRIFLSKLSYFKKKNFIIQFRMLLWKPILLVYSRNLYNFGPLKRYIR